MHRTEERPAAFINYMLDAEVDKKITETILYPTPTLPLRR